MQFPSLDPLAITENCIPVCPGLPLSVAAHCLYETLFLMELMS